MSIKIDNKDMPPLTSSIERGRKLTVVGIINVRDIAPSIMSDDVEHGTVEERSEMDREPVADCTTVGRRDGGRRGDGRASIAGLPCQRVVDRDAARDVRHVESPGESVDGSAGGLIGEAEQREDSMRDRITYYKTSHNTLPSSGSCK